MSRVTLHIACLLAAVAAAAAANAGTHVAAPAAPAAADAGTSHSASTTHTGPAAAGLGLRFGGSTPTATLSTMTIGGKPAKVAHITVKQPLSVQEQQEILKRGYTLTDVGGQQYYCYGAPQALAQSSLNCFTVQPEHGSGLRQ
jgi:hypothetical protein